MEGGTSSLNPLVATLFGKGRHLNMDLEMLDSKLTVNKGAKAIPTHTKARSVVKLPLSLGPVSLKSFPKALIRNS